ncbi:hypothetical protein KIN20_016154 [Parelaphostrongylus tenuis]|uniref:Uncharacterized protein n=1 Tax=Parelaphostrongylus tenuis TaxID=148309 RepID=A0AAD5MZG1_PARTN|nr:hypothetical protein KIN20_016154 [Parelaphostrongylus tenuis]
MPIGSLELAGLVEHLLNVEVLKYFPIMVVLQRIKLMRSIHSHIDWNSGATKFLKRLSLG